MMKRETFEIAHIYYVPVKRRMTLVLKTVEEIAASMLEIGQQTPILVRRDGARLVLVEGLHSGPILTFASLFGGHLCEC